MRGDHLAISEAAERGAELTRHLLAFARKQPLQPCETDPNLVLSELQILPWSDARRAYRIEAGAGRRRLADLRGPRPARSGAGQSCGQCPRRHARRRHADAGNQQCDDRPGFRAPLRRRRASAPM
ncbi:MAG: hypothetical protein MZV49_15770 [Rhodopseudomonas palustris]|nr:hypothetical protein [Rhodopseudomonas palustris]